MKILMLVEAEYPLDIRVRQEALKLKEHGHEISVVALKEKRQKYFEIVDGIKVYRVPKVELFRRGKHSVLSRNFSLGKLLTLGEGIIGYCFEYAYFTLACYLLSWLIFFKDGFKVIHTHNPPDTLFLVAALWRAFGVKFIYDHHDLSPELFLEKYRSKGKLVYKILLALERMSCKIADVIIATNESYKRIEIERIGVKPEKIYIVRNGPNLEEMKISDSVRSITSRAGTILCYLGAINVQDGLDYLLDALNKIVLTFNYRDILLCVIGDGDYLSRIKELALKLNLDKYVLFTGLVSDRRVLCRLLSTADIFVDAAPKSFLNDRSTFIKHMEYMVFGKPVVSFALKESMFSLGRAGMYVEPNNIDDYAKAVLDLIGNPEKRSEMGEFARDRVKQLAWDRVSGPLIKAYKVIEND